jgi:hypothetical protein
VRAPAILSRWTRIVSRDPFSAPIVVGGQVVGGRREIVERDRIVVTLTPFATLEKRDALTVAAAARAYANFIGRELKLSWG